MLLVTPLSSGLSYTPDRVVQSPVRKPTVLCEFRALRQPVCLREPPFPSEDMADTVAWSFLTVPLTWLPSQQCSCGGGMS